jgi:hypothetical protein
LRERGLRMHLTYDSTALTENDESKDWWKPNTPVQTLNDLSFNASKTSWCNPTERLPFQFQNTKINVPVFQIVQSLPTEWRNVGDPMTGNRDPRIRIVVHLHAFQCDSAYQLNPVYFWYQRTKWLCAKLVGV